MGIILCIFVVFGRESAVVARGVVAAVVVAVVQVSGRQLW